METIYIETPLGIARLEGDDAGIVSVSVSDTIDKAPTKVCSKSLQKAANQLQEYFDGKRQTFDLRLNPQGTAFQKRVWQALSSIPFGKTISYLELSKILGDVKAIRAVAAANGKNPLWVIVPCHRVIGSDGSLTGYAGGLHRKKWLIDHENPVKQQMLF